MSPSERFGHELVRHRKEKGLSQARLADRLGCSPSLIGHIETGNRRPQLDFAEACDRVFGFTDSSVFARLCRRITELPSGPHWFLRWQEEIEPQAMTLRTWDPLLIPGLLQTEDYARAIFRGHYATSERRVEEQVRNRMQRQVILEREDPPLLRVLLDEWILNRPIGTPKVMADQLHHLATVTTRRTISIQLVPYDTSCTDGLMSGFAIAESADTHTVVSVESAGTGDVSADPEVVTLIMSRYDTIRAEAYRPAESLAMIKEAAAQWTQRS
ncbi:helix-turn-helix transcriptional regulator [Sphaerisporangium sp. B11E5]|uniref:helix-turn-helix domain-containing protein n=1 Tax=Sphaerisporangium sp. B11E5 TaxID=3153563 RepID=UPI00325F6B68